VAELSNDSPVGRLLEELSWEGNAKKYRHGGRGLENVLVTEVFSALDLLPRTSFLGEVLRAAHGGGEARDVAAGSVEEAAVEVLPGGPDLSPGGPNIQPDAYLHMPEATVLVEAKRIRSGGFQPEQLTREFLSLMRDHQTTHRLLLLVLAAPPPLSVKGLGRMGITEAITSQLTAVHARAAAPPHLPSLLAQAPNAWAWITWSELNEVLERAAAALSHIADLSVRASVSRTAQSAIRAIRWHA
jgi:hypothetical protein